MQNYNYQPEPEAEDAAEHYAGASAPPLAPEMQQQQQRLVAVPLPVAVQPEFMHEMAVPLPVQPEYFFEMQQAPQPVPMQVSHNGGYGSMPMQPQPARVNGFLAPAQQQKQQLRRGTGKQQLQHHRHANIRDAQYQNVNAAKYITVYLSGRYTVSVGQN